MKSYYKINEISKLYNIGVDSIRYYEELGILHPKRASNGYRQYTTHDIHRLTLTKGFLSNLYTFFNPLQFLDFCFDDFFFFFHKSKGRRYTLIFEIFLDALHRKTKAS